VAAYRREIQRKTQAFRTGPNEDKKNILKAWANKKTDLVWNSLLHRIFHKNQAHEKPAIDSHQAMLTAMGRH